MDIPVAKLLADDTRAAICLALMDGRAWTAGELARHAGVAASTATEHLSKLVDGGLLLEERQGRHRYVRLAGADVAKLIEDMTLFMAKPAPVQSSLRAHRASKALAYARTCYDHMAGHLGVAITGSLIQRGLLDDLELTLTEQGRSWFADTLRCDLTTRSRRPVARACLDWTERKPHLAGVSGQALYRRFVDEAWVVPVGATRALRVTPSGHDALSELFGIAELSSVMQTTGRRSSRPGPSSRSSHCVSGRAAGLEQHVRRERQDPTAASLVGAFDRDVPDISPIAVRILPPAVRGGEHHERSWAALPPPPFPRHSEDQV